MDILGIKIIFYFIIIFCISYFTKNIIIKYLLKYKIYKTKDFKKKEVFLKENREKVSKIINKTEKDQYTPRMGGFLFILPVLFTVFLYFSFEVILGNAETTFLQNKEIFLLVFSFLFGSILGFIDDLMTVKNIKIKNSSTGLPLRYRFLYVILFSIVLSFFIYIFLNYNSIYIPFFGNSDISYYVFLLFFIFIFFSTFSTSNIDGLDGLAGGIMFFIYLTFGFISWVQNNFEISFFCFIVTVSLFVFLLSNKPPAKVYMSEVGYNALSFCLVPISIFTNTVYLLPLILFMPFVTLGTTFLQVISIRLFKKRIFKIAPIHHHLEAIEWKTSKIVATYWIITAVTCFLSFVFFYLNIDNL